MKFRKITSIVLTLSLLLSSLTVYSFGLDEKPNEIDEYSSEGVYIVCEETEKRGEYEKHFITSDSKFIAVSYPEQIHYVDENGHFQNIDCSLKSKDGFLSSNVGSYAASFPAELNVDSQLSIVNGKNPFSWCLSAVTSDGNVIGYSCSAAEVIENEIDKKDCLYINDPSSFELPNLSSTVRYLNVFEGASGVDAVYTVSYNKVEEDIVLNEKSNIISLTLNVKTGYSAVVNENGRVSFINESGESEFVIGIPYLYDAKDNICSNISVSAEQTENGYIIKYDLDKNWLDDESRTYPVVFDPSITTKEYNSNIIDTYVYEGTTNDHSAEARIYVGIRSGNKYRTYIKINNLPDIDPNCPILSASLTLKIYATTTTGKAVSLYKVNSSWNTSTLTFANQPSATPLSTCAFDASNLYYNLNLTTDFPYLYEEYNSVSNYGYMVRYTDESNTNPDWNSMYSMEYTSNTSYRPIFTVVYGYSLPDDLVNGGIYSFQNVGSWSLMTVHNGTNANDTNVYQLSSGGPQDASVSQKFKLEYVSSTGAYYLRAMCSSNGAGRVLDIYKTNGFVENGNNVQIYTANDPLAQHWLLVPVDSVFFKIIPRTNMSLALTAYGNSDGTANGKTSTSAGNIFVSEYTGSDYQKWFIYDCVNNTGVSAGTATVSNNTYYFNNSYTGKYLHKNTNSSANSSSGLVSNLGNTIRWKVTYHGDYLYTIQSTSNLSLYLNHTSSNTVSLLDCSGYSSIPSSCLWKINANTISFKSTSNITYYLSNSGTTLSLVTSRGSSGSDAYKKTTWRFCTVDYYSGRELNSNFSVSDMVLDVGESKTPTINKSPSNALWANVEDFNFSATSTSYISINNTTHTVSALNSGTIIVTATHKITNRSKTFGVKVNKNAIIIIPGIMGSELKTISSYGVLSSNEQVWSPVDFPILDVDNLLLIEKINALKFQSNGTPVCNFITEKNDDNFGTFDKYKIIYNELYEEYSNRYQVVFFPYDWRYSNSSSANDLNNFINNNQYDSVILIGHSMGGLVAANYLKMGSQQQSKVKMFISLGTPFFGSIDIVKYFQLCRTLHNLFEEFIPLVLVGTCNSTIASIGTAISLYGDTATDILHNIPSVYELYPNQQYFTVANKTYVKNANLFDLTIEPIYSYSDVKTILNNKLYGYNSSIMNSADYVNNSLFSNGNYITNTVDSYYIVGTGESTTDYVTFDSSIGYTFYSTSSSICGDGTVPTWSANLGGLYPSKTFYAVNRQHCGEYNSDTNQITTEGLIVSNNIITKVKNIIDGSPYSNVSGITQSAPQYLTGNSGIVIENADSSLQLYDTEGNMLLDGSNLNHYGDNISVITYNEQNIFDVVIYDKTELDYIYAVSSKNNIEVKHFGDSSCKITNINKSDIAKIVTDKKEALK